MRGFLKQAMAAGLAAALSPGLLAVPSITGDTATPFSGVPSPVGPARPQSAESPDQPNANPPTEPRSSVLPQDIPPRATNGVITPNATIDPRIQAPAPNPGTAQRVVPPAPVPNARGPAATPAPKGDQPMAIPPPGTPGGKPAPVPK